MKTINTVVLATAMTTVMTFAALAEDFVKGKVKKVDSESGKVTVIHEEIPNLDMPAMTMVFNTGEDTMAEKLEPGQDIEFVAERVEGKLTITKIKE